MKKPVFCIFKGIFAHLVIFSIILMFAACKDKRISSADRINLGDKDTMENVESSGAAADISLKTQTVEEITILPDDLYWTIVNNAPGVFQGIDYGDNKWVAVSGNYGRIMYSIDGENWIDVDVYGLFEDGPIMSVAYGDGKWVAGNIHGEMAFSIDGENWTEIDVFDIFRRDFIKGIVYGNDKWIAFGGTGRKMAYSTDGENWEAVDISNVFEEDHLEINCVAYGDGKWLVSGESGKMSFFPDNVAYSTDGINWTKIGAIEAFTNGRENISCISYSNGKWIAGSTNGNIVYSTDGRSWTWTGANNGLSYGSRIEDIVWGNNRWVAVGYNEIAYSADGEKWIAAGNKAYDFSNIKAVSFGDGKWVMVGARDTNNGIIAYANDN